MTWEPSTDPYFGDHDNEEPEEGEEGPDTLSFMVEETIAEMGCGHEPKVVSPVTGVWVCVECGEADVRAHDEWLRRRMG